MNKTNMGRFLKELRESRKLTMNQLIAELNKEYLGVTIKAVSNWEAGKDIPELEKLVFLAGFYGLTIDEILEGNKFITEKELLKKYGLSAENIAKAAASAIAKKS